MKLIALAAAIAAALIAAPSASAAVYLDGNRVKAVQVGAIDAAPCPPGANCARAVIQMKWGAEFTGGLHQVRCPRPRNLHTVAAYYGGQGHPRAVVFACRRTYDWRLA